MRHCILENFITEAVMSYDICFAPLSWGGGGGNGTDFFFLNTVYILRYKFLSKVLQILNSKAVVYYESASYPPPKKKTST